MTIKQFGFTRQVETWCQSPLWQMRRRPSRVLPSQSAVSSLYLKPVLHKHRNEPSVFTHSPRTHTLSLLHSSTSKTQNGRNKKASNQERLVENGRAKTSWQSQNICLYLLASSNPQQSPMCITKTTAIKHMSGHNLSCKQETKENKHLPQLSRRRTFPSDS